MKLNINKFKQSIIKRDIILAVLISASIVFLGVFMGWYNNKVVPVNATSSALYNSEPNNGLSFMSNWDGPDYLQIATSGYSLNETNFFPLYPLLVHIVNLIIRSTLDSALLVSWLCLIGAVYFYLKIVGLLFKEKESEAVRAVSLFLLSPTAVFLIATYTESLFAFLALGAIYFSLKQRYVYAGLLAAAMSATHITGIFVLVLIGLILWEEKAKLWQIILSLVMGSLGILSYIFYLNEKFHQPFAFITAQKSHGWLQHGVISGGIDFFNVVFISLIIASVIYWWSRRKSFSIYSLLFLTIPAIGKQFGGFNRYVLMAFPVFLMLYAITKKKPGFYSIVLVISTVFWSYFMLQYAGGYVGG